MWSSSGDTIQQRLYETFCAAIIFPEPKKIKESNCGTKIKFCISLYLLLWWDNEIMIARV